jgi:hypothetical protein
MSNGKKLNKKKKYPNINISGHIFDADSIKSFYILVNGYFNLSYDELFVLKSKIGKTIKSNLNREVFDVNKFIQLEEIREGSKYNYAGYEYTMYLLKKDIVSINELSVESLKITDIIYDTHFNNVEFIKETNK